ncbi:sirohydrochlorin chelatase [Tumebacillus permanentifrigoris]|uniref:Sirohydrochlorin cobaltochelatase n=1 Tax=Tumebacillus permanentifrigoris TaxID=378543 RepID=A0A316D3S9_9BACL|nr:CbiX/SirB N-terminal domain-containing protein [Tumebacillus permanentifrigoris]PWK05956.1 sirohydrochlorin cobaltochelatase [Tumebacillus permanentifrigoris]
MPKLGIVVLAHGSEVPGSGEETLAELAAFLRSESGAVVEVGYLNFQSPRIAEAVTRVLAAGVDRVTVAPFFLSEGYLMRKAVRQAKEAAHGVEIKIASPLGQHPRLLDVVLERMAEAMGYRLD